MMVGRNQRRVWIVFLSLILILSGSCTRKHEDDHLNVFRGFEKDDVKTWDPANAYDSVSLDLVPLVYETLYQYTYLSENYQLEPLLAESLPKYSKDQLTLTIPIRKGIRFQDDPCFVATQGKGRELKAQDFVYGIKRLAIPSIQSRGWWVLDGKVLGANEFHDRLLKAAPAERNQAFQADMAGVKALDDFTLQIKLLKPDPALLPLLAMNFASPVAHEAVEKYADAEGNISDHPIGTGPFILKRWDHNREVVLEKSPTYRGELYPSDGAMSFVQLGMLKDAGKPLPLLDRISMQIVKEDQPRWLNFLKGNRDAMVLPKDNFRQAITGQVNLVPDLVKRGIHLHIEAGTVIRYISFNMKDSLVGGDHKYLRQALSSAIDREEWLTIFTNGTGKKMVSAIPPGIPDRPKSEQIKYDLNLARAKELLIKAGYPNGKGLPPIQFDLRGASTTDRQFGEFITEQWEKIGVKTDVITNTFPAYLEKMKQGNTQVAYGGWNLDYPDAENIYQLLYGPNEAPGPNDANYNNPVMNKLYDQMSVMKPGPERAKIIEKIDALLQEDCPWAMGYYEAAYDLSQPWLMNFRANPIILNRFKYYRVDNEIKKRYLEGS